MTNPNVKISTRCPACRQKLEKEIAPGSYVLKCPKCGHSGAADIAPEIAHGAVIENPE